ncbi:hypothetical protein [Streptomyces microflavus]|uniref:Ricin B lectin domain-containing protein n=1 Tax=Streptomyces microflavus TaxID=1919 RepID=A0ABV1QE99_STRMI
MSNRSTRRAGDQSTELEVPMSFKKRSRLRAVVSLAGAACLAAVNLTPAHAAIPGPGTVFQVQTQFEGKTLCVSAPFDDGNADLILPLLPCDEANTARQWQQAKSGHVIENLHNGGCLTGTSSEGCAFLKTSRPGRPAGKLSWRHDDQGRVWMQGYDSLDRVYWGAMRHREHGPVLYFPARANGTIPDDALVVTFPVV